MTLNIEEKFWSGNFGDSYIKRNSDKSLLKNNYSLFKKVLKKFLTRLNWVRMLA